MTSTFKTFVVLMMIALASSLCVLAASPALNADQQQEWDRLRNYAVDINDELCSTDIVETLDEANLILQKQGLGDDFMYSLFIVRDVSGDLPAAAAFRTNLLTAFYDFANSIGFSGQTLDNKTIGNFKLQGVEKPVLHNGHKAPPSNSNPSASASLMLTGFAAVAAIIFGL